MSGPRPLFDKKDPSPGKAKPQGQVIVTDHDTGRVLLKEDLVRKQKPVGVFTPPPRTSETIAPQKKSSTPVPLFQSTKTTEVDVTVEDKVKFTGFDTRAIMKIKDASETIDLTDRISVIQYGQELNKKLAASVDEILKFVKTNTFGERASAEVKKLHSLINFNPAVDSDSGFLGLFKKKKTLAEKITEVVEAVEMVSREVEDNVKHFLDVIPKFDELLDGSKHYHSELMILIAAGKDRIEVFGRRRKTRLEAQLSGTNLMEAQHARDEMDIFESFKKRVETLELSLSQNELTIAQIRMSQATNVKMVENLNNIITNMIPLWKHSLISSISTNNFDAVNKNKDVLAKSICDIITPTAASAN